MLVGLVLRFHGLDSTGLSLDEGLAWDSAAQPIGRLLELQPQLDSGKLAVYDVLLHYWIQMFGDSLRAMRSLSAVIDTVSILLIFALVRELYKTFAKGESGELAAGLAALLFATNVTLVQSARTARMYPLMTAAELAQIFFFIRAQRRAHVSDIILATLFLALAIAANFTAAFILVGESVWLAYLLVAERKGWPGAGFHVVGPALSLIGGLALLLPWVSAATHILRADVRHADFCWIKYRPTLQWSLEVLGGCPFNKAPLRLFLLLAAIGIWRHRNNARLVPMFLAAATVGPFLAIGLASVLGVPMMVDRYVIIAIVSFLGLAAVGAGSFRSKLGQIVILILIVRGTMHSLRHSASFWVDWRQAVTLLSTAEPEPEQIGVFPPDAVHVVRYHMQPDRRPQAVGLDFKCGSSRWLILSPGPLFAPVYISALKSCYPHLVGRVTRLEIRSR